MDITTSSCCVVGSPPRNVRPMMRCCSWYEMDQYGSKLDGFGWIRGWTIRYPPTPPSRKAYVYIYSTRSFPPHILQSAQHDYSKFWNGSSTNHANDNMTNKRIRERGPKERNNVRKKNTKTKSLLTARHPWHASSWREQGESQGPGWLRTPEPLTVIAQNIDVHTR